MRSELLDKDRAEMLRYNIETQLGLIANSYSAGRCEEHASKTLELLIYCDRLPVDALLLAHRTIVGMLKKFGPKPYLSVMTSYAYRLLCRRSAESMAGYDELRQLFVENKHRLEAAVFSRYVAHIRLGRGGVYRSFSENVGFIPAKLVFSTLGPSAAVVGFAPNDLLRLAALQHSCINLSAQVGSADEVALTRCSALTEAIGQQLSSQDNQEIQGDVGTISSSGLLGGTANCLHDASDDFSRFADVVDQQSACMDSMKSGGLRNRTNWVTQLGVINTTLRFNSDVPPARSDGGGWRLENTADDSILQYEDGSTAISSYDWTYVFEWGGYDSQGNRDSTWVSSTDYNTDPPTTTTVETRPSVGYKQINTFTEEGGRRSLTRVEASDSSTGEKYSADVDPATGIISREEITYADGSSEEFAYDENGNLISEIEKPAPSSQGAGLPGPEGTPELPFCAAASMGQTPGGKAELKEAPIQPDPRLVNYPVDSMVLIGRDSCLSGMANSSATGTKDCVSVMLCLFGAGSSCSCSASNGRGRLGHDRRGQCAQTNCGTGSCDPATGACKSQGSSGWFYPGAELPLMTPTAGMYENRMKHLVDTHRRETESAKLQAANRE